MPQLGQRVTTVVVESLEPRALLNGSAVGDGMATVTPTLRATLPAAVVAEAKPRNARVSVLVANTGGERVNEPVTVELFLSTDATLDAGDVPVGPGVVRRLSIAPGASRTVKLTLPALPDVPEGDYLILARTTAAAAVGGTSASDAPVNIAPPFIDLTGAFDPSLPRVLTQTRRTVFPLTISNLGNVAAKGNVTVALSGINTFTTGVPEAAVGTFPVKINLQPGSSKTVRFRFIVRLPTSVDHAVAVIDEANTLAEKDETNNEVLSATEFSVFPFRRI